MNALVTGGTGFIGSHLVEYLTKSQYVNTKCLVRSKEKWLRGMNFERISGSLSDLDVLKDALKSVDVLFHVAAIVKAPTWQEFKRANVDATEDLVRLAKRVGVKKIVILSSLAAVGPSQGQPVDETTPFHPVSMYGRSKMEMEKRIQKLADDSDSITIVRPPAVFGPREDQIYSFFKAASKGICPIIGDGNRPPVSMIHVQDLVRGIWMASQLKHSGVESFFISNEEVYTWNQIKDYTARALDRKVFALKISPKLVHKIGSAAEQVGGLIGVYPVINSDKANELTLEWTCSIKKAQKVLHFQPELSLYEGILHTVRWYQQHHWI